MKCGLLLVTLITAPCFGNSSLSYQLDVVMITRADMAADPEPTDNIVAVGQFDSQESCVLAAPSVISQLVGELKHPERVVGAGFKCTEHM